MNHQSLERLVAFCESCTFHDLPEIVVEQTKLIILDTLGCAVGGFAYGPSQIIQACAIEMGGAGPCTILVSGKRTSCVNAAFANSYFANFLDADDTLLNYAHLAHIVVPSALAVAEKVDATGERLITATALGYEIAARVGLALRFWTTGSSLGVRKVSWSRAFGASWLCFGATAAAGKLLGLTQAQTKHAFGISGYSAQVPTIGSWDRSSVSPMTKYTFCAPISQAGIMAALLASKGFTGDVTLLDKGSQYWRALGAKGYQEDVTLDGLGAKWWLLETSFKAYPACRYIHHPLDVFSQILSDHEVGFHEIEAVTARIHAGAARAGRIRNKRPEGPVECMFSIPYCLAMSALGVEPGPAWFDHEPWEDPVVRAFMEKVEVETEPEAEKAIAEQLVEEGRPASFRRTVVTVKISARGRSFEGRGEYARGDPWASETRMEADDLIRKFEAYAGPYVGRDKAREAWEMVLGLERLEDLNSIIQALTADESWGIGAVVNDQHR